MNFADVKARLRIPLIGAPMFIVSVPDLVIAQCKAGIVGSFPALNARPAEMLEEWIVRIKTELAEHDAANPDQPSAPFAVNQIVHRSNDRLQHDLEICVKHEVPIVITSLGAREEVNEAVHSYGGLTLHDIIHDEYARKAIDKGADGLIAVCAGAGGHAGTLSPFALIQEIRQWFDGPLALSGCIANGRSILAAEALGADVGYMGSGFIATTEANAPDNYKQGIVDGGASDIVYTNYFSGVHGNYLAPSIKATGLNPYDLPDADTSKMDFKSATQGSAKVWKDIWGAGQGVGGIKEVVPTKVLVDRLATEYAAAKAKLSASYHPSS